MINSKFFTGLIEDPRSIAEKLLDHKHEELIGVSGGVDPFSNKKLITSPFVDEDQQGASSCVPHGVGRALAIERARQTNEGYQRLSWTMAYRLRSNYPAAGCWLQDELEVYRTVGAALFTTFPDPQTEDQANSMIVSAQERTEAAIFKGLNYVQFNTPNDIVTLATVASQGKGVPILLFSTYEEWSQEYPKITIPGLQAQSPLAEVRHCVCILPNSGFIENGVKYVTIQDSAHFGGITIRHLSEEFIAARVYGAAYWTAPAVLGSGPMPVHTFTKVLKPGMNNSEVVQLQKLLIAEGFLSSDCATGFFGGMTLGALHAWQNKYAADILVPLKLDAPTDTFGSFSIAKANSLTQKKI